MNREEKMNKIKIFVISLIALFVMTNYAFSVGENVEATTKGQTTKVSTAGSQFLKVPIGARGMGMAGAYGSVANDLSALYWNPAGISDIKTVATEISYLQWFATYSHSFAAASFPLNQDYVVAVNATSFSSGDIQITTIENPSGTTAKYTVSDLALGVTLAGYLTDQFSFGITAKYINNSIYNLSSNGVAFDIGTMYNTGIYGIKIGFSIHNLGGETSYAGQSLRTIKKTIEQLNAAPVDMSLIAYPYSYPLIFRASVSSELYNEDDHKVIGAFDFNTFSDVPEQFSFGAEYSYADFVALRAGYQTSHDQFGFAAGIGIKYEVGGVDGRFDYAINPTKTLGLVNRFTIGIRF